jgi:glycosyltransferase involved in cell wall biosynthesis
MIRPPIRKMLNELYQPSLFHNEFIYPATAFPFKNHKIIIKATDILLKKGINNFEIKFTLDIKSSYSKRIHKIIVKKHLPITFIGFVRHEEILKMYKSKILIFSSKVESYPLPIFEAISANTPIIAYEEEYSRELLNNYKNVQFFNNELKLAEIIESKIM